MKKLFILSLLVSLSFNSFAQDTNLATLPDSSKLTVAKVYSDVKAGMIGLAQGLKTTAEHVYVVLVKQQVVNSVFFLVLLIVGLIFLINFFLALKNSKEEWGDYDNAEVTLLGIVRIIQGIASAIVFLIGLGHLDVILMGIINPEYGAIKDIISFVK